MWKCWLLLFAAFGSGCGGVESQPLVLLVTVDTLRADHLGAYGDGRGLTPNLDALAEDSIVFRAAYTPSTFTLPSIASMMTGRYPSALGLWANESKLPGTVVTLATQLDQQGWNTSAVVSNWVLRETSGLAAGFDRFDAEMSNREAIRGAPERLAPETTTAALFALDECAGEGSPCFLWVHYQDPHGPYDPPDELRQARLASERGRVDGKRMLRVLSDHVGIGGIPDYQFLRGHADVGFYRAGYAGEVSLVDAEIGRLLSSLEDRGLLSDATIIFAADHGESLGEENLWFAHGEHLSEAIVHIPLFIRSPALQPGVRTGVVSLIDLYPTVLSLAVGSVDKTADRETAEGSERRYGRDLLSPSSSAEPRGVFLAALGGSATRRYGFVHDRYKLMMSKQDSETQWNMRLVLRGDDELDISGAHPKLLAAMLGRIQEVQHATSGARREWQELDAEDELKLRALGYATD